MSAASRPTAVSREELKTLCRMGEGAACCRYLGADADGIECLKHSKLRRLIDGRVAAGTMVARGDNCFGKYPCSTLHDVPLTSADEAALDDLRVRAGKDPIDALERGRRLGQDPGYRRAYHERMMSLTVLLSGGLSVCFCIETNHPSGIARHLLLVMDGAMAATPMLKKIAARLGFLKEDEAALLRVVPNASGGHGISFLQGMIPPPGETRH
jgi:hypothetical protein